MKKIPQYKSTSKLVVVTAIIMCSTFFSGLSRSDTSIVGEWSGIDSDGDSTTFVFNADKSAEIRFAGLPPLSTKNLPNGSVEWSGNIDDDPIHLDVIILMGSEEKSRIRMIARFVDNQTLKIQMSRNMKTRPKGFEMIDSVFQILAIKQ